MRSSIQYLCAVFFVCCAFLVALSVPSFALESPGNAKILMLPPLDLATDHPEMHQERLGLVDQRLRSEFLARGFLIVSPEEATRAAATANVDLTASDERTHRNLTTLGKNAGATWVVTATILEVGEARIGNLITTGGRSVKAKVELRILEVSSGEYLTNKIYEDKKVDWHVLNATDKPSLFQDVLNSAVGKSTQDALSSYPIVNSQSQPAEVPSEKSSSRTLGGLALPHVSVPALPQVSVPHLPQAPLPTVPVIPTPALPATPHPLLPTVPVVMTPTLPKVMAPALPKVTKPVIPVVAVPHLPNPAPKSIPVALPASKPTIPAVPSAPVSVPTSTPTALDTTLLSLLGTHQKVLLHLKNFHIVVGTLETFNGKEYLVKSMAGSGLIKAGDITSVDLL